MSTPGSEASQLIKDARAGSDSSLGLLLGAYRDYLLRIAGERIDSDLRPKLAASDVVQGSMLIATRKFQQFRGETEQEFRAWLVRILSSHLIDGLRRFVDSEKRRTNREVSRPGSVLKRIPAQEESPSRLASLQEEGQRLLLSIESLPGELRDVVHARYLGGLTFPEIATRLQIPVTTCRHRWLEAVENIGLELGMDG